MTNRIPQTMRGVQLTAYGDYDKLAIKEDIALPRLASTDVLIKVLAAGVNNTDLNTRIGWYAKQDPSDEQSSWSGKTFEFPRIQGADVCGEIVAVGDGVDEKRIGQRVIIEPCLKEANGQMLDEDWYFGSECDGGFAQYTKVASRHAYAVNSSYSDVGLASFPCSYSTAENLLTRSQVKAGDKVFITGASGGVGSAAIQLAKARGAQVWALTSQSKQQQILDLGVDGIALREKSLVEQLGANSMDVVVDLVAGDIFPSLLDVLRAKGRYATSGAIGGAMVELDVRTLYLKDLSFFGCTVIEPEVFGNLVRLIEEEKIKPLVAKTFPLEQIVDAQKAFATKQHVGKLVLEVTS
ncbi:MAG: alcohol dehydrogenase family protein [Vibrio sp.]